MGVGLGYAGQSGTLVLHRNWEQGGVGGGKSKLLGREVRNSHRTEKNKNARKSSFHRPIGQTLHPLEGKKELGP